MLGTDGRGSASLSGLCRGPVVCPLVLDLSAADSGRRAHDESSSSVDERVSGTWARRVLDSARAVLSGHLAGLLAFLWFLVVGLAFLAPALWRGVHLGPYDLLGTFGLGTIAGTQPHNVVSSDQIDQMAPWATLAWHQVHSGHLPLWNPYSAMGLPLAFNFQSATFSLPLLVGYLFPSGVVYTVALVVKLVIAGTGVFFLSRVLGTGAGAATFAGTVFELSGAFTGWLGWPQSGTFCWLGWLLGAGILVLRTRRWSVMALFAVSLAFATYGGHPEALAISLVVVGIVLAAVLVSNIVTSRNWRPIRSIGHMAVASLLGLALASPLLLPGAQLISRSVRSGSGGSYVLPTGSALNFAFAGYYGFPILHSQYFGPFNYYESACYVGLIVLVLALVALWYRWRRIEVTAMAALTLGLGLIVFTIPGAKWVVRLPGLHQIIWTRAVVPMDALLAVLAGFGLQAVLDDGGRRRLQWRLAVVVGLAAVAMGVVYLHSHSQSLSAAQAAIRRHSFLWPSLSALALVVVALALPLATRARGRHKEGRNGRAVVVAAAWLLAGVELAFLLTASPQLESSSSSGFVPTAAETRLLQIVGTARVGFSSCTSLTAPPSLGILPEANAAYGLAEVAAYDPILPKKYLSTWSRASGVASVPTEGGFCPSMSSGSLARQFGVSYLLTPAGAPAPSGTILVGTVGGEGLYRVPGAGIVTVVPDTAGPATTGSAVPIGYAGTGTITFAVDATGPSTLRIHVTDLPGWSATVDGHPLALHNFDDIMMAATVGPGHHQITLRYWPRAFTVGLVLAALALCVVVLGLLLERRRSQH